MKKLLSIVLLISILTLGLTNGIVTTQNAFILLAMWMCIYSALFMIVEAITKSL